MSDGTLTFRLLGTGSSGGVPRVGNDWGVCDPAEPKNRRTRCCALVTKRGKAGDTTILIDTSPDVREQLLSANVSALDAVVYTHDHADQTHGIDDIRALALRTRKRPATYMDAATAATLTQRFAYIFEGKGGYPAIMDLQPPVKSYQPLKIEGAGGAVEVLPLDQEHGRIRSLGFRIGDIAYCNDVNTLPERTLNALEGLDVFIVDALRYTPHPSHASLDDALEWVDRLKPRRTILTNLHIDMDYATLVRELPAHIEPGYDGLEVMIGA